GFLRLRSLLLEMRPVASRMENEAALAVQFQQGARTIARHSAEPAMKPPTQVLDELLPLLQAQGTELHDNAALLEVSDAAQLVELASNPKVRRYLLARLSDTVALIDPGHAEALARALLAEGHTPRMAKGFST